MKVHHVGYAVENHDRAEQGFIALGYTIGPRTDDTARRVCISFARNGTELVEIISPLAEDSPVSSVLAKNGPSAYHLCYETPDLAASLVELRKHGWRTLIPAEAAPALEGSDVAFLYNRHVGLIELVERPETDGEPR
ncbi:VOC family protein [Propioniciclava tarda]|uniref:VOC family protein n=1 Tax=Propioniciclava tarda TaxID=433330 RepID=A0A4Q9KNM9_PROTD|nr:VOC family protein [Propioniciclava tarda]TBT96207.1 VOC family protein [Propioniciclava tarda]SMO33455.1 methylmalonyl-CoA epimerase [Propioniciclava tarda]